MNETVTDGNGNLVETIDDKGDGTAIRTIYHGPYVLREEEIVVPIPEPEQPSPEEKIAVLEAKVDELTALIESGGL